MRRTGSWIVLAAVMVAAGGCASRAARGPQVEHVVLCWLKQPGDEQAAARMVETSHTFRTIPGVLRVSAGRPIPSTRPVVDSSFDVGIVMSFEDEAALQAYEAHPKHVEAVREVLRPLAAKIIVYDVRASDGRAKKERASD